MRVHSIVHEKGEAGRMRRKIGGEWRVGNGGAGDGEDEEVKEWEEDGVGREDGEAVW